MLCLPAKCVRCGTPLKKQVIGSNNFYYCRKCGCMSSAKSIGISSQSVVQKIANI